MCEFSENLVAWLDRELPPAEGARLEQHLENCAECRTSLAACSNVSAQLAAYCDSVLARPSKSRRVWMPVAAGVVAAAVAIILLLPRPAIKPEPVAAAYPPAAPAGIPTPATSVQTVRRHRAHPPRPATTPTWQAAPTEIQIAIPADAIFPPGAVPEGVAYIANFSIAADGSPQGFRIIP